MRPKTEVMPSWIEREWGVNLPSFYIALAITALLIVGYAIGIADGKRILLSVVTQQDREMVKVRECNASLSLQLQDAKRELTDRETLLGWTAKYIREKQVAK